MSSLLFNVIIIQWVPPLLFWMCYKSLLLSFECLNERNRQICFSILEALLRIVCVVQCLQFCRIATVTRDQEFSGPLGQQTARPQSASFMWCEGGFRLAMTQLSRAMPAFFSNHLVNKDQINTQTQTKYELLLCEQLERNISQDEESDQTLFLLEHNISKLDIRDKIQPWPRYGCW